MKLAFSSESPFGQPNSALEGLKLKLCVTSLAYQLSMISLTKRVVKVLRNYTYETHEGSDLSCIPGI